MEKTEVHVLRRKIYARKRLAKKIIKKMPRQNNIRKKLSTIPFSKKAIKLLNISNSFWSFKENAIISGVYVGAILTCLPLPIVDIPLAILFCWIFKGNLSVSIGLLFLVNPLTSAPVLVGSYKIGDMLLRFFGAENTFYYQGAISLVIGGVVVGLFISLLFHIIIKIIHFEYRYLKEKCKKIENCD